MRSSPQSRPLAAQKIWKQSGCFKRSKKGPNSKGNFSDYSLKSLLGALVAQHPVAAVPEFRDERAGAWSAGVLENDLLQDGFDVLAATGDALVLFVPQIPDLADGTHVGVVVRLDH